VTVKEGLISESMVWTVL